MSNRTASGIYPTTRSGTHSAENRECVRYQCVICHGNSIDQENCFRISSVSINNYKCAEIDCGSPWRVCRACLRQGAAKLRRKIKNNGLCHFHVEHGEKTDIIQFENDVIKSAERARRVQNSQQRKTGNIITPNEINAKLTEAESDLAAAEAAEKDIVAEAEDEVGMLSPPSDNGGNGNGSRNIQLSIPESPALEIIESRDSVPDGGLIDVPSPIIEGRIRKLLTSEVYPDPCQPRKEFNPVEISKKIASILKTGQDTPIKVLARDERGYMINDGEMRWRACVQGKIKFIYAIVVDPKKAHMTVFQHALISNFNNTKHTPQEIASAIKKRIKEEEDKADQEGRNPKRTEIIEGIAVDIGISTVSVYKYLSLMKLPAELFKIVDARSKDGMPLALAFDLARLGSQAEMVASYRKFQKEGISVKTARGIIREHLEKSGCSSRKEKRNPKDDFRILRSFVDRTIDSLGIILNWTPQHILELFLNRKGEDKTKIINQLDKIIAKLQDLRETIYNKGSIHWIEEKK